jgi:hypothetical protein
VPIATVNRILKDPTKALFENVVTVGSALGMDFIGLHEKPVAEVLRERALVKARYIAQVVQGTQGLEAAGVDSEGYARLVEVAANALLAGKKRKLWDED